MNLLTLALGSLCLTITTGQAEPGNDFASVELSGDFMTGDLQGTYCRLPETIGVVIMMRDVSFSLTAQKSSRGAHHVPTYVIEMREDGKSDVRQAADKELENYAVYLDLNNAATIMITCPEDSNSRPLVEGTVQYEGRQYHLRQDRRRRRDASQQLPEPHYQLLEVSKPSGSQYAYDYLIPPEEQLPRSSPSNYSNGGSSRHRRQAVSKGITIDITVVIAYDHYMKYYNQSEKLSSSEKDADAMNSIRKYTALILAEANLHFQMIYGLPYNISVSLQSIVFAKTSSSSPWTENLKENVSALHRPQLDCNATLLSFAAWMSNTSSLASVDFVMLFTNFDIYRYQNTIRDYTVAGFAFLRSVCSSAYKVAVIEDDYYAKTVDTIIHEIGHGCGAQHDGESNPCSPNDTYVMSPSLYPANRNINNMGKFSPCSIQYMDQTFQSLARNNATRPCLYESVSPVNIPSIVGIISGQVNNVTAQCREQNGPASDVCRTLTKIGDAMCTALYCSDPSIPNYCTSGKADRGTSCGNKKWCVDALCVYAEEAPAMDETCPFGDMLTPPVTNVSKSCTELVTAESYRCYGSFFFQQCCRSCKRIFQNISGCEYGDKASNCQLSSCPYYTPDSLKLCCRTCAVVPTTTTTTQKTTPKLTITTTIRTTTATTTKRDIVTTKQPTATTTKKPTTKTPTTKKP